MKHLLQREWLLAVRRLPVLLQPLMLVWLLLLMFPLAVGTNAEVLVQIGPGVLWVAVLLAALLAADDSLKYDYSDGSLAQLVISGRSLLPLIAAKALVQLVVLIVPIVLLLPMLYLLYQLPARQLAMLALTVFLGAPTLLLLALLGAALTLSLARGGVLLLLVIAPFYLPTILFAVAAVHAAGQDIESTGQLAMIAALALLAIISLPFAIVAAIWVALTEE